MKRIFICSAIIILSAHIFLVETQAQNFNKQEIRKRMDSLSIHLQPSARQKVIQSTQALGNKIFSSGGEIDIYAVAVSNIKSQFSGRSSQEIDALVAIVMFELWKTEEEDLKEILDEMHKMNQQKEKQRDYIDSLKKQKAAMKENLRNKVAAPRLAQARAVVPKITQVTARTRRLNIKYIKVPILPAFKDPRKMTFSELENEISAAEENQKALGDMTQLDEVTLQDIQQEEQQMVNTIAEITRGDQDTPGILQNIR